MKKTNAMRILDSAHIEYSTLSYDDNTDHILEKGAAGRTAEKLGISPEAVFKTIVMRSDSKEIIVFCQKATSEINLKKARLAAGVKELTVVKPEELLSLTGYVRGGCSPIGMKRTYRTFIDASISSLDKVYLSAGLRGEQLCLNPKDLITITNATVCDLVLE